MTAANHTATTARSSHTIPRTTWIFPGRIDLALVVNWQQAPMEAMVRDLKIAREQRDDTDSILIRLRHLSTECSRALALCIRQRDAASAPSDVASSRP